MLEYYPVMLPVLKKYGKAVYVVGLEAMGYPPTMAHTQHEADVVLAELERRYGHDFSKHLNETKDNEYVN